MGGIVNPGKTVRKGYLTAKPPDGRNPIFFNLIPEIVVLSATGVMRYALVCLTGGARLGCSWSGSSGEPDRGENAGHNVVRRARRIEPGLANYRTRKMKSQANPLKDILATPEAFGLSAGMLLRLDEAPDDRHLAYLDLMPTGGGETSLNAVLEADGTAAIYLASDASLLADPVRLGVLRGTLACRGDARYLGVAQPGVLNIFPLGFYDGKAPGRLREIPLRPGGELHDFLAGLSEGEDSAAVEKVWLENYLLELLRSTARNIKEATSLNDGQVLSLVGRGLFARFIVDRRIVREEDAKRISADARSLEALFDTPEAAADSFAWLDATFNGNLLPLLDDNTHSASAYLGFFSAIGKDAQRVVCLELGNVMRRAVHGQLPMKWQRIQFDHVPADTLSQVYEHFAHLYWREFAAATSIHYTPRRIAQVLVEAAFAGLRMPDPSLARVLDPAVGAGVFLVLAFKRLVRERWKRTGQRPERDDIRYILENQLCGLDFNPEALTFAALSLYLTALELDPSPMPLAKLKFKALNETGTLLDVAEDGQVLRDKNTGKTVALGSLSVPLPLLGERRFDMVIGNPPWTKLGKLAAPALTALVRDVATGRASPRKRWNSFRSITASRMSPLSGGRWIGPRKAA